MAQRAWNVPKASVTFALLACFALSTQFLFQRSLYGDWSVGDIASAWLDDVVRLVSVAAVVLVTVWLAGRLPVRRSAARALLFALALLVGASLGEWLGLWWEWGVWPEVDYDAILPRAFRWVPLGAVGGFIVVLRQRTVAIAARLHESEVDRLQLERQQVALRLQVLQSQIEPHFLFNTLATIRRLQHTDPERGRDTLAGFVRYLRSSLPELRASETTLGRELDLVGAYLDVLQVRMGERLAFTIDVPSSLRECRLPPLSLATLVENSIKHGLAGLPEGGTIRVEAWLDRDDLCVRVIDTGAGLTSSAGTGTGLANLRLRLRSLYGEAAGLLLTPHEPRGFAATLRVPARRRDDVDVAA
jgi:hypothetical protein